MDNDLRVLEDLKLQLTKGYTNFKKSPKERLTENYAEVRQEILEQLFKTFTAKYELFIGKYGSTKLQSHFEEDVFETVSEMYLNYKVELRNLLSKIKVKDVNSEDSSVVSSDKSRSSLVKLPKIKIPTFSGNYLDWSSFRDLFMSLIHNNQTLDDVQRLHYLRSQLSGEAEQLIKHVPITANNYKQCWEMLVSRYNNKKYLSNCILKRLFSQRNMLGESANALKELLDVTSDCLHELSNLGIDIKSWDVIVIYIVSLKLDVESRKQWELQASRLSEDLPSFNLFKEFLETRFRALEFVEPKSKYKVTHNNTSNPKVLHTITKLECPHCSDDHKLFNCKSFSKEDVDKRRDIAQSLGVCFNCLGQNHSSKFCRVVTKCRICQRKHHTLLHPKPSVVGVVANSTEATTTHEIESNSQEQEISSNIATHFLNENAQGQVLLATALVGTVSENGSTQVLRALLDQGSQASFITEAAVQLLRLKKVPTKTTINGIGGSHGGIVSRHVVYINIQSLHDSHFSVQVTAHVLSSLTSVMPDKGFEIQDWPELQDVKLADPRLNAPHKIDLLLGAEIYCQVLKEGLIKSPLGSPVAQDTYLGWIVSGRVNRGASSHNQHNIIISMHAHVDENDMLKQLWELDSEPLLTKSPLTPEEQACEEYYNATTQRDDCGRYVVRLPFRYEDPPCKYGNSKTIATKRFLALERKLARNVELKQEYSEVINEYLLLGHLEKITNESDKKRKDVVYLPHHAVVRQDKVTTKVRVVLMRRAKVRMAYP